ncbi:MAG: hypothetical protein K9M94_14715 [Spirochaetia bacterium]|nr:hypothetical protein [Spirochaetia bacterium]
MKKILDGVRYDTEKAERLGATDNLNRGASGSNDLAYWKAALYRTPRSGRYFLSGSGGPMSRFSQSAGQNSWRGGSDIIPMSEDEAYKWAEDNLPVEDLEAAFPDRITDA